MKRILFCSGYRMIAYDWSYGRFSQAVTFEPDSDGYRDFERYLRRSAQEPVSLLIDLIEEEFTIDTAPFVRGQDRKAVLDRKLQRYFRTSDLRLVKIQGREKFGRKDLKILIAGLGNMAILKKWLAIIEACRAPLKSILSIPLIGESLLAPLKLKNRRILMISQQAPSTIRLSFYDNGHIKASRLAHHTQTDNHQPEIQISRDIINTMHYLRSQRLLKRNEALDVFIISDLVNEQKLQETLTPDGQVNCQLIPIGQLKRKIGIRGKLPTYFADGIFSHMALQGAGIANHYAPRRMRHYYRYHLARNALRTTTVLMLVASLALGAHNLLKLQLLQKYAKTINTEKGHYLVQYQDQVEQFDQFRTSPDLVKSAVNTLTHLEKEAQITPLSLMGHLAQLVNQHPEIVINKFHWLTSTDLQQKFQSGTEISFMRSATKSTHTTDTIHYQITEITGQVTHMNNNYRLAVELFNKFINDLKQSPAFHNIIVTKTPFDINSETDISGGSSPSSGKTLNSKSTFTIRIVAREGHD